jgi:hypothetical protein
MVKPDIVPTVRKFFRGERVSDYLQDVFRRIENEIETMPLEQLDRDLVGYYLSQYAAKIPTLSGKVMMDEPEVDLRSGLLTITLYIPFTGDPFFFDLKPSHLPRITETWRIEDQALVVQLPAERSLPAAFERDKELLLGQIRRGLDDIRREVGAHFDQLGAHVKAKVEWRKTQAAAHGKFVQQLSSVIPIRRRNDGAARVIVPVARKTLPVTPSAMTSEPAIELAAYDEILATIHSMVTVFERSPAAFRQMDEEQLRTILLVGLNGLYEGRATGETFNGEGRSDILIRHNDRNVFIAECLIWGSGNVLLRKLDNQLFRYSTWRDCKLALLIFSRYKNFSHVVCEMHAVLEAHPQRLQTLPYAHETGARYLFRRPDDPERQCLITALAFNVPSDR